MSNDTELHNRIKELELENQRLKSVYENEALKADSDVPAADAYYEIAEMLSVPDGASVIEYADGIKNERDQLAASNARWMKAYIKLTNDQRCCPDDTWVYCADSDLIREFDHIAESTPQQSLAEIQARAVESAAYDMAKESWRDECGVDDAREWLFAYAVDIRISEEKEREK